MEEAPVVIIGSSGKTGKLVVTLLSSMGINVKPTNREGKINKAFQGLAKVGDIAKCDVTKLDTIQEAVRGAKAVIFTASASSKGGNAQQVDFIGVENTAKACVAEKVSRLVVISSGAVSKPNSIGYKITNIFGGIMGKKLQGENSLKKIYEESGDSALSYAIIRPGGLTDTAKVGASKIELNQKDTIIGEISRDDVAEVAVAAAISKNIPSRVTFEVYGTATRSPLEGIYPDKSGFEQNGDNYDSMFKNLKD